MVGLGILPNLQNIKNHLLLYKFIKEINYINRIVNIYKINKKEFN